MSPSAFVGPGRWRMRSLPAITASRFCRRQRAQHLAVGRDELEALAVEEAGVEAQPRHRLGPGDRRRHVPVGAELDEAHVLVEQRRARVEGLADDDLHLHAHGDAAVAHLVGAQHELGDVDQHHARPLQQRCPAQPLQRQFDLPRARRRRHLQLRQRGLADHAVRRQAVAPLEGAHRHRPMRPRSAAAEACSGAGRPARSAFRPAGPGRHRLGRAPACQVSAATCRARAAAARATPHGRSSCGSGPRHREAARTATAAAWLRSPPHSARHPAALPATARRHRSARVARR